MATMAPALTSEAANRARDTLPGAPTPPSVQVPLVNGRDYQMNKSTKGGGDSNKDVLTTAVTKTPQIVNLSKDFHRRLAESGHLAGGDAGLHRPEPIKASQIGFVNLGSISDLSGLGRHSERQATSVLQVQQLNKLINSGPSGTISAASKNQTLNNCATPSTSACVTNGMTKTSRSVPNSSTSAKLPAVCGITTTTLLSGTNILKNNQVSGHKVGSGAQVGQSVSKKLPGPPGPITVPQTGTPMTNGFHSLKRTLQNEMSSVSNRIQNAGSLLHASLQEKQSTVMDHIKTEPVAVPSTSSSRTTASDVHCKNLLENVARRQRQLEARSYKLLRQLRRLQSRQAISHTKQQLSGFVDHQLQAFEHAGINRTSDKSSDLYSKDIKNMSTAALVNLVHKMQSTQVTLRQQLASSSHSQEPEQPLKLEEETCMELDRVSGHLVGNLSHLQSTLDSDATESSSGGESCDDLDYDDDWDGKVQRPPIQCRAEWRWASERSAVAARWTWLQAQVSDLEYRIRQQYDIYKQIRANKGAVTLGDPTPPEDLMVTGKPKSERTTRKLSPLEEKIATLQAKNEMSPSNISTLLSNVDKQSNLLTQQMGPLYTPLQSPMSANSSSTVSTPRTPNLNGFVDNSKCTTPNNMSFPSDLKINGFDQTSPAPDHTCQAARCRPVKTYRKRKLLRTMGLHTLSRKAARLSTVQCRCYPPMSPCAMCGGRYNNTVQMEAETLPYMEKCALVDLSFHPVLSFPQDVSLATHFESMLKTGTWQQKPPPKNYRVLQTERGQKLKEGVRKYTKRLRKTSAASFLSPSRIRNRYDPKLPHRNRPVLVNSPVKTLSGGETRKLSRSEIRRLRRIKEKQESQKLLQTQHGSAGTGAEHPFLKDGLSPFGNPALSLREALKKKRMENAYDINNIVIPYSIASSTRVEKLQYKEILTPKWREVTGGETSSDTSAAQVETETEKILPETVSPKRIPNDEMDITPGPCEEPDEGSDELEDLSDDVFKSRHFYCEISERKRFSTIPSTSTSQRRSRGAQRADSVVTTETDPIIEPTHDSESSLVTSQLVTPPATPAGPAHKPSDERSENDDPLKRVDSAPALDIIRRRSSSVSSSKSVRSRSASHSEERSRDDFQSQSYHHLVRLWSKRSFPLNDEDYDILITDRYESIPVPPRIKRDRTPLAKVITEEMLVTPESVPASPVGSPSDDPSEDILEDPDDPEWTVISEQLRGNTTKQPNLVLKLSKR